MKIPAYPPPLCKLLQKNNPLGYKEILSPNESEEQVVREMRLHDSIENNNDPNDMPLEVEKNLKANLGPIDTEAEIKAHEADNLKPDDEPNSPHP